MILIQIPSESDEVKTCVRLQNIAMAAIRGSFRSTGFQFVGTEEFYLFVRSTFWNPDLPLLHPGWGGFTPLHYAALHGNRVLVDLFLSNGADPNVTCDAGQTAFHFGCRWARISSLLYNPCLFLVINVCVNRQGNIYIMHQMMQYGADLRLSDLQGKTSMHHAVTGGNM